MNNEEPLESCLKRFNFTGWSPKKIIERYENVLASREKQITDLSMEIGNLYEKNTFLSDKNKTLFDELELTREKLEKRVKKN
jgi:cell division protein FtsB